MAKFPSDFSIVKVHINILLVMVFVFRKLSFACVVVLQ